ncbi:S1 family serine peptidase [Spirilliplanes yamanashiensis]|uniref:Trypsin n=1 Tax=Spirilliplanes yamanashiensis TaxID=42233 RepID=A0A8J3Y3B2_9ACTN|nr:serine protease [Spirilliplanes yamanashiensis]MDP9814118.1 secreted trypsin-like serine protease [Spirilliplanes yamanashiensis]GIJ00901.1 trypsin [Spirilliplanes yamanashiensis]
MLRNALKVASVVALVLAIGVAQAPAQARPDEPVLEVVGGDTATQGQFPWIVRLSMGCGGTLYSPRVVLTAAHCVGRTGRDTSIVVTAGAADLGSPSAVRARSVSVVRAPGFTNEMSGDDWALVKLDRALKLPTVTLTPGTGYDKGTYTVAGWGQVTEENRTQQRRLRWAEVPAIGDSACAKAYAKVGVTLVTKDSLCAGKRGVDACQGDSGGPLLRRDGKGRWLQVGIVSWGIGCARPEFPGVYTQVSAFRSAIAKAAAKLG